MKVGALLTGRGRSRVRAEGSAAAGGVILITRFAATALINYGLGLALAWLLVPSAFGVVSAIQNVLLLAAGVLTAGLPWALAIRMAATHGDPAAARPEFRAALLANSCLGALLGVVFLAVAWGGVPLVPAHSLVIELLVAAEMPVLALNAALAGAAQGSRRFSGLGAMQTGEALIKSASAVFLVTVCHAGPAGVAAGFLIGTVGSVMIGVRACRGLLPGRGRLAGLGFLSGAGSIWLACASMMFLLTADLLGLDLIGAAAGITAVVLASYQACGLLAKAGWYAGDAIADAVFPFMASQEGRQARHAWFMAAVRWVPLLILPAQLALILAPGPVLRLFLPHGYAAAQTLMRVLAAGTLGAVLIDMLMKGLFASGYGHRAGRRMPVMMVAEMAGLVILVPRYGALGAAQAYLIASWAGVAVLVPLYREAFRARLPPLRRAAAYTAGLAPTAAVFALAGWVPDPAAWALIVAGLGLFAVPARRLGLITGSDVDRVRAAARAPAAAAALRAGWLVAAVCAGAVVIALGYHLFTSPDVLYDEAAYTSAAQKVALGWQLTLDNTPLFVHPPLMFLIEAGWLRLTGYASAPLPAAIHAARLLSGSFGIADVLLVAGLCYRLAARAGRWRRGALTCIVALLTALDPVLVRYDRQDVIEPFALCVALLTLHAAWHLRDRRALAYVSVTGLAGGLALLTNEITAALVAVPLLFAVLERNRAFIRRAVAAFAIALAFLLLFLLWSVELGLGGSFVAIQDITLQRIIGLVQITGLNVPGVSLPAALRRSVSQYGSSYVILAAGVAALGWSWCRRNTQAGNFLAAWLTASCLTGAYLVAAGTLNEQFFVYLLPGSIVGSVLFADALISGWIRRRASRVRARGTARLPLAFGAAGCAGLMGLSAASWAGNYGAVSDGVVQASEFITATLPPCATVNASGDAQKYIYLTGRFFASFAVGPAALADGVHYFLLSPNDATEQEGNMTPRLADWIRAHGQRLAIFPSQVYKTVQVWRVPSSPYDALADISDIPDGVFVTSTGSNCGGYSVTDGAQGGFFTGYAAMGGKAVLGDPLSRAAVAGPGLREQLFDGAVLAARTARSRAAYPLPIVAMLATASPRAYERAGLPPVVAGATAAQRRGWLTEPRITRAYLAGQDSGTAGYLAAVARYGEPLGPPAARAGGGVSQAFADVVLQTSGPRDSVHTAPVTPVALVAGLLPVPARSRSPQTPPPLPNPNPFGPPEPDSAEPFAVTLGAAVLLFGAVVAALGRRRRRSLRRPPGGPPAPGGAYPVTAGQGSGVLDGAALVGVPGPRSRRPHGHEPSWRGRRYRGP